MNHHPVENTDKFAARLRDGTSACNHIFGLTIPNIPDHRLGDELASARCQKSSDEIFRSILFLLGDRDLTYDFESIAAINRSFLASPFPFDRIIRHVNASVDLTDSDLLAQVSKQVEVKQEDLRLTFANGPGVWVKINHAWWELVASHALEQLGRSSTFYRDPQFYEESGCVDLIARSIPLFRSFDGHEGSINCRAQDLTLAISFNAGRYWNDQITTPLPRHQRGAMLGAPAFLQACLGEGATIKVGDGAAVKKLALQNGLGEFCDQVKEWSEAVVFITPQHLATIKLDRYAGPVYNLVVPSRMIHELWPSVLAYCAGALKDIFRHHTKLSIFVQAAVMSAPICALARCLADQQPGLIIRAFDFGQVLDLAQKPGHRTHVWGRNVVDVYPEFAQAHVNTFILGADMDS